MGNVDAKTLGEITLFLTGVAVVETIVACYIIDPCVDKVFDFFASVKYKKQHKNLCSIESRASEKPDGLFSGLVFAEEKMPSIFYKNFLEAHYPGAFPNHRDSYRDTYLRFCYWHEKGFQGKNIGLGT